MFSELEKKWTILHFCKTFLLPQYAVLHFKISGRAAKSYQRIQFTRVLDPFNKTGSIHKKKQMKKNRSSGSGGK
ncbi:Hypothetical protein FKW44_012846, partial [Caligus rogercresseyi]